MSGTSDFIISLGSFGFNPEETVEEKAFRINREAGTLMHELGHNLGLQHGGDDDVNYKPNYLSVMNYSFQTNGIPQDDGVFRIDYSWNKLDGLNEKNLNESDGIGQEAASDNTYHSCGRTNKGFPILILAENAADDVNWNCNNIEEEAGVEFDINGDGFLSPANSSERPLSGYDDWSNLNLRNGAIGLAGVVIEPLTETFFEELTFEQAEDLKPAHEISIDVKPWNRKNYIISNGRGVIPVAIFGTEGFDASQIDPNTLSLDGQSVFVTKRGKLLLHFKDINRDGLKDLLVFIRNINGTYQKGDTVATMIGETYDGDPLIGFNTIHVLR